MSATVDKTDIVDSRCGGCSPETGVVDAIGVPECRAVIVQWSEGQKGPKQLKKLKDGWFTAYSGPKGDCVLVEYLISQAMPRGHQPTEACSVTATAPFQPEDVAITLEAKNRA